jgi:uncharacterized protein YdhG (YjbR/CyaY superfamily)
VTVAARQGTKDPEKKARAKRPAAKAAAPKDVDEYLSRLPAGQRAALTRLRRTIKAAAPGATESISYMLPTFKVDGKALIYIGAAKAHCAIYGSAVSKFASELARFDTSTGTIRFTPDDPLPAALVTKLVKARLAQIKGR